MEAFDDIYWRYAESVLHFARRCVGRRDIAEEITCEAFLELYRNLRRIDSGRLPAWLFAVVRNRAIHYWRWNRREIEYFRELKAPASSPSSLESLLCCRDLKPVHRACLILHYVHGMIRGEIAEFIGVREAQIKGYLRRGLSVLRSALAAGPGDSRYDQDSVRA